MWGDRVREISRITLAQATAWVVMLLTELRNSVGRANFAWVVMGSRGIKGDGFYFGHIKCVMPLKHSNGDTGRLFICISR